MRGRLLIAGVFWLGLYAALALAPLAFILLTHRAGLSPRPFWTEFSVALGFVGLAMMTLQFVLTARFTWLKAPYGSDVVYRFHKIISLVAVGMVVAHPAILFATRWEAMKTRPFTHPWPFWLGTLGVAAVVGLVIVSLWRQRLGVRYDGWRRWHAILAVVAIAAGIAHVLLVGHYLAEPWQRGLWLAYTLAWAGLIAYVRLAKPAMELGRPWSVVEVRPERGRAWTLRLAPRGHEGMAFGPGQFAWITMRASPFSDREHPFSFSGSAGAAGRPPATIEFTIKELGDWTARVKEARPGETVYVDGPFGALTADRYPEAEGFALFAGGIGITPMISHLRTFADRGDPRPLWLVYGGKDWDGLTLREEIEALRARLPSLAVVYALAEVPAGAAEGAGGPTIARGFITRELLERHVPGLVEAVRAGRHIECFICGPQAMMDATERALHELGVPLGDYHAERFNLV